MRPAELVIGSLLVLSGIGGPLFTPHAELEFGVLGDGIHGDLWLDAAMYEGNALMHASDGAFRSEGPVVATLTAPRITITYWELSYVKLDVATPVLLQSISSTDEEDRRDYDLDDATIQIRGKDNGILQGWPTDSPSQAVFEVNLEAALPSQIVASPITAWLSSPEDSRYKHLIEAPVYAVAHEGLALGDDAFYNLALSNATFTNMNATGNLLFIVENADLQIEHADGTESLSVWQDPDPVGVQGTATLDIETVRFAAITIIDGEMTIGVDRAKAAFISKDPTMHINGTTKMGVHEGSLKVDGSDRSILDEVVTIVGNTTLDLVAEGEPDGQGNVGAGGIHSYTVHNPAVEDPEMKAGFHTDSEDVHVGGTALALASSTQAMPMAEQATLAAMVTGVLLMVWGVGRTIVVFVVGMVAKDPLKDPRRREIYGFLGRTGMAYLSEIHRATGIPIGSLQYHLGILQQGNLVTTIRRGGYRIYFIPTAEFCGENLKGLALLSHSTRRRICEAISAHGSLSQHELADQLGVTGSAISRQLATLVDAGLVERKGSRDARYHASDLLQRWLDKPPPTAPINTKARCDA